LAFLCTLPVRFHALTSVVIEEKPQPKFDDLLHTAFPKVVVDPIELAFMQYRERRHHLHESIEERSFKREASPAGRPLLRRPDRFQMASQWLLASCHWRPQRFCRRPRINPAGRMSGPKDKSHNNKKPSPCLQDAWMLCVISA
jgi:hypothetical protein